MPPTTRPEKTPSTGNPPARTSTVSQLPPGESERRAEVRYEVDGLDAVWGVPRSGLFAHGPVKARVLNVSSSGLLVLAPQSRQLAVGARIEIELCGGHGVVEVRYVQPSARRRWRLCGVDLVDMNPALGAAIREMTSGDGEAYVRPWASVT